MSQKRIYKVYDIDGLKKFKKLGEGVIIYENARIIKPEIMDIGDYSRIDDFSFLYAGKGIKIGKHVHIASFVSIIGNGYFEIGDYGAIAAGARILTSTNDYRGGYHMSAASPREQQNVISDKVIIGKDGFIGTNAVIHPGVFIGEGAIIGSNALVLEDVEPWTINVGTPCKQIGKREKIRRFT
jgi:galactoside O-acetyltransferase